MEAVAIVIAIIALIYFLLKSPPFRLITAIIIFCGVMIGVISWAYYAYQDHQRDKQYAKARELIFMGDLETTNFVLKSSTKSYFDLVGIVKNNSKYAVESIQFLVTIQNCDEKQSNCVTVGEEYASATANIPSKQAREINTLISFKNLPELKNYNWKFVITSVTADIKNVR